MLSDSPIQQKLPSPLGRTGTWYPDSTKSDALKLWLVCGNLKQVSASMNIPYDTLRTWRASKWWNEMAMEVRTEGHLALSHKMQKLADKAMEVTLDRLENGDSVIDNRTGELRLKPVSMRDAHQVAVSFQDRAIKLTAGPGDQAAQVQIGDRLAAIAEAFAKMVKLPKQHEVIDVPFKDVTEATPQETGSIPEETYPEAGTEVLDADSSALGQDGSRGEAAVFDVDSGMEAEEQSTSLGTGEELLSAESGGVGSSQSLGEHIGSDSTTGTAESRSSSNPS